MGSQKEGGVRIFFDHLYFSVCCVLVGFLFVYCIARWTGHGFDLDNNFWICSALCVALSLILAAYFTYVSTSSRPSDYNVHTKRKR
jgi:hypothetical protein